MTEDFIIPLNGLKAGKTEFFWRADEKFFRNFDNSDILAADISVAAVVEKSGKYLGVDAAVSGTLTVPCDRCLEDVTLPISADIRLSVKFGAESAAADAAPDQDEREVIYVPDSSADLDLSQTVYDYACLALPMQRVHPDGGCSPEVMRYLSGTSDEVIVEEKQEGNSPFAVLKGLKMD